MSVWSWSKGFAEIFRLGCRGAVLALLLVAAPSVTALGLGEITLKSSLNDPLDAEIVVLSSEGLDSGQMLVSLASVEAYQQAGIERDFFHTQMQFSVVRNSEDQHSIRVLTEQPVTEPYLNFLVQLQWPAGRVMREYTLLLDLPIYSDDQQQLSASPAITSADVSERSSGQPAVAQVLPNLEPISGDQHQVIAGDTLWNVAARLRPENATIHQTMDSLYRYNAEAFVEGDANRIKAGHVLRLPSYDEISLEAGNTVAAQIGLINPSFSDSDVDYPLQGDSSLDNSFEESPLEQQISSVQQDDDGRLELASAFPSGQEAPELIDSQVTAAVDTGETVSGVDVGESSQINQLADKLALANDEVNKAQQENIELRERLALLEAQVATMAALLEQADNSATAEAAAPANDSPVSANSAPQNLGQQLAAVPAYIWLLIIAVILVLLVLLVRKTAREQESRALGDNQDLPLDRNYKPDSGYQEYDESSSSTASGQGDLQALDDFELDPDDNLFDESDEDIFEQVSGDIAEEADEQDMTVEAVAEADVYLSLGKTAEAIEVLEEARAQDLADASSRLKLMEVLFRENRKDELGELFTEIKATGDQSAIEMAAAIMGPESEQETVEPISGLGVAAELEGLDFQTSDYEDPGLGNLDLDDLELDELAAENHGEALEDLDLDNLTADDFDIEPADSHIVSPVEQSEVQEESAEPVEEDRVSLTDADPLDDFADFENVDEQSAVDVKLDLAKTYLDMGDPEGAREILDELIEDADDDGAARARALLETLD